MNPLIPAGLVAALLLPVPPQLPGLLDLVPAPGAGPAVLARPGPEHPGARWPLDPRPEVVAGFIPPRATWSAGHRGVDLLGTRSAPVRAALGGRITFAGTLAGRGVVVVEHGGFRTTYEPVSPRVRRGDVVATGAVIGTLQLGRSHCAPRWCLHWGLIRDGTYRDPLSLLRPTARVRLLPLPPLSGPGNLRREGERAGRPDGGARW
jgi:murein DD-endopeptidase MepM/ murein hydrolase activator NlpD